MWKGVVYLQKGMSKDMYDFIVQNRDCINIDLENGIITTPKGTNGTICSSTGYLRVKINKRLLQVHQILAVMYFKEKCIGMTINHIDGNKMNNKKENLEPITFSDNVKHQWRNGLANNQGFKNRKLTDKDIRFIRKNHTPFKKQGEFTTGNLASKFGVDVSTIRDIVKYNTYKEVKNEVD